MTAISIFIDSTMISVSPSLTSLPGSTSTFHTLPGTGLSTAVAPKGSGAVGFEGGHSSSIATAFVRPVSCQRARSASKAACCCALKAAMLSAFAATKAR